MEAPTTDGAALQLHACEILTSNAAALQAQEQIFDLLVRDLPVAVTVHGLDNSEHAEGLFAQVCGVLESARAEAGAPAASVSIAVDAAFMTPQLVWMTRREILGPGPVYLLANSQLTRPSAIPRERRRQDQFWLQCWHLRESAYVRTALAPMVSSPCPLFTSEPAFGILPPHGLQIPPGTAWASMQIELTDYVNERGDLSVFALRESLQRCVDYGDKVHDDTAWPNAAMCHDGWLNRRLAISVNGIGDLARIRGVDPQSFAALQDLGAVLQEIRNIVNAHSRKLATEREHAPSLSIAGGGRDSAGIIGLAGWQSRWQAALQYAATRHRNLLAISPWSMFPRGESADNRYCDLLPLLAHADVCSFPVPPCIKSWNVNEFKYFHNRTWAVLAQKDAQQMIAEQV